MKKVLFILLSSLILLSSCNLDGQGIFNDILSSEPVTNEKVQEFIGVLDNNIYVNSENGLSYYDMNASAQNTTLHTPNEKEQYAFYKFVFKSDDGNKYALKFINDSSDYHYEVENIADHISKRVDFKVNDDDIKKIIDLKVYYVDGKNVLTAIVEAGEKYYLINVDDTNTLSYSDNTLTVNNAKEITKYKDARIIGPNAYKCNGEYYIGSEEKTIANVNGFCFLSSEYAVSSDYTVYDSTGNALKDSKGNIIKLSGTPFYTKAGVKTFLISDSALITDGINNEVKTLFSSLSGSTKQYIAVEDKDNNSIKVYRVTASNGVYCTTVNLSSDNETQN